MLGHEQEVYRAAIPQAEQLHVGYLAEHEKAEGR
jgi:hypothetical protein